MNKTPLRFRALYLIAPDFAQKQYTKYLRNRADEEAPIKEEPTTEIYTATCYAGAPAIWSMAAAWREAR